MAKLLKSKIWKTERKQKVIVLSIILILIIFGFGREALAIYNTSGNLTSTNLLLGQTVGSIDSFFASTTQPTGTSLWIQFSQDLSNWYSAGGVLNATTSIANGTSTTDLSGLSSWSGANFYYKMYFNTTDSSQTPVLDEIKVNYTTTLINNKGFVMSNLGYVGIGTTTPSEMLTVWGGMAVGTSSIPTLYVASTTGRVGIGTTTPGSLLTVTLAPGVATSTYALAVQGSIKYTGTLTALSTGLDVAERYPIGPQCKTDNNCPEAGDLVSIGENGTSSIIKKSSISYDSKLIGVISENPAIAMEGNLDATNSRLVALAGRVPVKVSLENGPIEIGDLLTSASSTFGVAMKATELGRVIGIALENFDQSTTTMGEILVFVNPHWYGGQLSEDGSLASAISADTSSTSAESQGLFSNFVQKVKEVLSSFGLTIENGVAQIRELVTDKLFAKKARIEKLEMVDQTTGEIYCTWIENGEWQKVKGACDQNSQSSQDNQTTTQPSSGDNGQSENTPSLNPAESTTTVATTTEPTPTEATPPTEQVPIETVQPGPVQVEQPSAPPPSETAPSDGTPTPAL